MKTIWTKFVITLEAEGDDVNDSEKSTILEEHTVKFQEGLEKLIKMYHEKSGLFITLNEDTDNL